MRIGTSVKRTIYAIADDDAAYEVSVANTWVMELGSECLTLEKWK